MGFFDDLKYKREAKKAYQEQVASVKADIARHLAEEPGAVKKLDKLLEINVTGQIDQEYFSRWNKNYLEKYLTDPSALRRAIDEAERDLIRGRQARLTAEKELVFMRPNTKDDWAERKAAYETFAGEVLAVDPEGALDLRFHATTLVATKDILKSGGLISSVDRMDGFMETTNMSNEISVSEIQNIQYSLRYWMDMGISGDNGCRPCGCMFVVQPRTQEEADMISNRQMHNVYFKRNPEQLVAIVTTSENVERVQNWVQECSCGLARNVVCTFADFPRVLEWKKEALVPEYKKQPDRNADELGLGESLALEAIRTDPSALRLLEEQTPVICLTAVKINGLSLQFVRDQTPQICMEAVQQTGSALQYVKEQTPEICAAAIKTDPMALKYVKNPSLAMCSEAVKRDRNAMRFVPESFAPIVGEQVGRTSQSKGMDKAGSRRDFENVR